jgi:hypothetical protein
VQVALPCAVCVSGNWIEWNSLSILQLLDHLYYKVHSESIKVGKWHGVVLKAVDAPGNSNACTFLIRANLDTGTAIRMSRLNDSVSYENPQSWLDGNVLPKKFIVEPFDQNFRELEYQVVCNVAGGGKLNLLYMVPKSYDNNWIILYEQPVHFEDDYEPVNPHDYKIHSSFFKSHVKKLINQLKNNVDRCTKTKYSLLVTHTLIQINVVRSGMLVAGKTGKYASSVSPAFFSGLFLNNSTNNTDLSPTLKICNEIILFLEANWNFWPK